MNLNVKSRILKLLEKFGNIFMTAKWEKIS